mmetsp:Transcript_102842/g.185570  ORF Transcript_102842/g.185570 Transcript_102842/m.185570 type:complete len:298 (+) Transcript_102842:216-1109(+)
MPVDHLVESGGRPVSRLVKECGLDGSAKDQAADGHDANDGTAAEQADSRSLWRVPEGTQGHKRTNEEVAVSHADLNAPLPRLQAFTVEGHVLDVLPSEAAVREDRHDLISCKWLLALVLDEGAVVPDACRSWDAESHLAVHQPVEFLLNLRNVLQIRDILIAWHVQLHAVVVPPAHLRRLSWTVGLCVHLQSVQVTVLIRILPLLLRCHGQDLVQELRLHDGAGDVLQVRHFGKIGLLLLFDSDSGLRFLGLHRGAPSASACAVEHCGEDSEANAVGHKAGRAQRCREACCLWEGIP